MGFDPSEILAQIHEHHGDGARLGLAAQRLGLLDDEPVKFGKPVGIEFLSLIDPLQPTLIEQPPQRVPFEPAHLGRAECERRQILREIKRRRYKRGAHV